MNAKISVQNSGCIIIFLHLLRSSDAEIENYSEEKYVYRLTSPETFFHFRLTCRETQTLDWPNVYTDGKKHPIFSFLLTAKVRYLTMCAVINGVHISPSVTIS